jgi:hypothetical protein
MTQKSTIEFPPKDLHLVYSDRNRRGFDYAFLQQHIAQKQGVQVDQVQLQPPFVFDKKRGSLTFSWRLNH